MRTYRLAILAAMLFVQTSMGQISFSFNNVRVTSDGVSFDVAASSNTGASLGDAQVYLDYDFGENAAVSATLSDAMASAYGAPIINHNTATRVSLTTEYLGGQAAALSGSPVVLFHVLMKPSSGGDTGQVSFYEPLMEGQQYASDLETAFSSVTTGTALQVDLTNVLGPVLMAASTGAGKVQLDWTAESGTFEVEQEEGGGFKSLAHIDAPIKDGRFVHTVEGLELGTHTFRIRKEDAAGNVTYSEPVVVTVEMVEEFLLDPVYPNPFNPQATIRFAVKQEESVRIELYNALGQRVRVLYDDTPQPGTYHEVRIDGSDLAGGLYIVRVEGESFAKTQQVMLVK